MSKNPKPGKRLSAEAKKLWSRICEENEMDAAAALVLGCLCESFDRMRAAQLLIAKLGLILTEKTDKGTVKVRANPACAIEKDARAAVLRAWALLGFDQVEGPT
jgi:P27 family predicted phage terminase small subunit